MKNKIINSKIFYIVLSCIIIIMFFTSDTKSNKKNIGVVKIEGTIMESEKIIQHLNEFNDREDIKAIIIRLNTPGGSVAPSQEIFQKVKLISESNKKPIIASISSVAASGGYYIAIGADKIVANPGSITGSIGVIITYPIAKELIDKIGLKFEIHKSGKLKDSGSPYRIANEDDRIYFKEVVDDMHRQFTKEVSIQRGIDLKTINKYSDGRIFTGEKAYNIGLIDTLGSFEDALNISKNLANIQGDINLIYPDKDKGHLFKMLFEQKILWSNFIEKLPMFIINN